MANEYEIRRWDVRDVVDAAPDLIARRMGISTKHPVAKQLDGLDFSLEDVACSIGREKLRRERGNRDPDFRSAVNAALTSDDLGDVLEQGIQRVVLHSYNAVSDHRALVAPVQVKDYTPVSFPQIDVADSLDELKENETAPVTGVKTVAGEQLQIRSWGRVLAITRKVLLQDSEGSIQMLSQRMGNMAALNEARTIYEEVIEANNGDGPTLSDGSPLWSGQSLVTNYGGVTEAALNAGMSALRSQTTAGGHTANFDPRILLVHPAQEFSALKLVREISTNTPRLRVIAAPWLSQGNFYLFADPQVAPVIVAGSLQPVDGEFNTVTTRRHFDRESRRMGIGTWQDFGAAAVSRRGAVKVTP